MKEQMLEYGDKKETKQNKEQNVKIYYSHLKKEPKDLKNKDVRIWKQSKTKETKTINKIYRITERKMVKVYKYINICLNTPY